MKSINKFIGLALLSGALLTSCSDSFLQRDSLTESSSNTFWQTPDDALMALASCYDALQSNQLYNSDQYSLGPLYMDCISDNGGHFNWSGWMEGYDMAMGIHTPSSSIIGSYWKDCYEVISRCNVLIANIDRVDMDASQKAIYQAEAKTIRALMYINLTMTYQDVPFLTAPLTIDEAECEKTDRAAIVAHIMTDLQDAAEVLPQNASSRGHITKGAALSLLGRVALYNEKWDDAIAAYKQVQGLGYSLDPSYAKLFTQSGETSPEIIFAVRYEGPGMSEGAAFNAHWNTPLEAMNGTIDLADAYYCKDGKPTTDTKIAELNNEGGLDVSKPNPAHFENRDPRLYSTLFVPGMLWNGKGGIDTSASNPYANVYGGAAASLSTIYVYKYFDPTDTSNSWDNGQDFYVAPLCHRVCAPFARGRLCLGYDPHHQLHCGGSLHRSDAGCAGAGQLGAHEHPLHAGRQLAVAHEARRSYRSACAAPAPDRQDLRPPARWTGRGEPAGEGYGAHCQGGILQGASGTRCA